MNTKLVLFLSCFAAVALTASTVNADRRGHGGGQTFTRSGMGTWSGQHWGGSTWSGRNWNGGNWSGQRWGGGNWNGNWRHHYNNNNEAIFIGSFGFPYWGWGLGYPYGYYGYGYPYGYGYGYGYPYGYDYYGGSAYGYGYGYGDQGYGYGGQGYGYGDRSRVAQLQRRLARAGYYSGAIDGIMGPQTRRAIRAYERSHGELSMR
ncbi:MAG: hypothetical protein DME72_07375 [Verrucomicrobia bacterium]|nr:MAG: hypothetical protein DME72_07375 [Verrucomicrobiota bacterium]